MDKSVIKELVYFINANFEEANVTISEDGRYVLGFFRTKSVFPEKLEKYIASIESGTFVIRLLSVNYATDYVEYRKYTGGQREI